MKLKYEEINPQWIMFEIAKLNSTVYSILKKEDLDLLRKEILEILNMRMRTVEDVDKRLQVLHALWSSYERENVLLKTKVAVLEMKFNTLENEMKKLTAGLKKKVTKVGAKHLKKDMKEQSEIMEEASEIKKIAAKMKSDDKKALKKKRK